MTPADTRRDHGTDSEDRERARLAVAYIEAGVPVALARVLAGGKG